MCMSPQRNITHIVNGGSIKMLTYNQQEHEKWIKRAETDIACVLVLADFEWRKKAFLNGSSKFYGDGE
jgi:hypothetical protein